jgi:hypothetical protein
MKLKYLLTLLTTAALSFNVAVAAEDDTELAKEMKVMNKNLRTLKRQSADPAKKEDNLALLALIKKSLESSHKLEPAKTKDVPAAEKEAYLAKYHEQMRDLSKSFDELEAALKADKADEAKKIIDKLGEQKQKGHKDFAPEDDH